MLWTASETEINWTSVADAASASTPALAINGNTIYMAIQGPNNSIQWSSSNDDGKTWADFQTVANVNSTAMPSLAVMDGTLYLNYVDSEALYLTSLADTDTNNWTTPSEIQNATANAAFSSLIVEETASGSQQLAIYFTSQADSNNGSIQKIYQESPNSWSSDITIANQTASGPLSLATYGGQTYIAYQGGTILFPSDDIYITTSSSATNSNNGADWTAELAAKPSTRTGVGLAANANGLILSYGNSSSPGDLQFLELSQQAGEHGQRPMNTVSSWAQISAIL